MVLLNSIWFRRRGKYVELLVEVEPGKFSLIARESIQAFSHKVEATGILRGVPDPVQHLNLSPYTVTT